MRRAERRGKHLHDILKMALQQQIERCSATLRAGMSNCSADTVPIILEHHPNDSIVKIDDSGNIQTLTSGMGTGGGNVPMVMMPFSKSRRAKSAEDFETWKESRVSNTINTFDQGDVRATDVVVALAVESHPQDSRVKISEDNVNQPLSANMEHNASNGGLVLILETFHLMTEEGKTAPLKARDYKDPLVIAMDRAAFNQGENAKYDFQIDGGGYSTDAHRTWSRCSLLSEACAQATTSSRNNSK